MKNLIKKHWYKAIALLLIVFLISFNKKPSVSSEDRTYLNAFLDKWNIHETPAQVHQSFNSELAFISKVQDSVIAEIHHTEVPFNNFGNAKYYFLNKKGLCYDRAVLLEKFFILYGFSFRHVFIYFNENNNIETSSADFYKKQTGSHALTEIETSKGWMAVGTNCNWLGIAQNGSLLTIKMLKDSLAKKAEIRFLKQPCYGNLFWNEHPSFKYVYGVYSRKGKFFSSNMGLPEMNLQMLFYNF